LRITGTFFSPPISTSKRVAPSCRRVAEGVMPDGERNGLVVRAAVEHAGYETLAAQAS